MPIALPQAFRRCINNIPLRWILVVPFVLQTVGAVVLVGYLSYRNGQRAVSDLAGRLIQEKGDQVALYLESTLEVPHLVNRLNADGIRLGQLPGLETQDPAPLEKFLWAQLLQFPDVTSIAFANERGGMIGSGRLYQSQSIAMSVYRTPQFARGTYSLSPTDAQGNITETKIIAQNYDVRTRPWYQTPAQAGKATWSPIYQYVSHLGSLGISAGLPYTDSGKLQGVLTADINLKKLNEFLSGLHISSSGQVFIIERSGQLVASSTNQSLSTTQAGKKERLKAGESKNPIMRETMAQIAKRFGDLADIEAAQQFTIKQTESPQFGRVIPFQDRYGLDWLIVVVIPESDFIAAIQHNARQTFLLCLLTLGVAITLGLLTADKLTARFAQLNQVSRELAAGNLDQRLPTDRPIYELNSLARTFNQMAEQVQQSFGRVSTALAESEEKFTTIFRTSPDPMAIATLAEGRFLEVNDSLTQFFGYSHTEMIGRTALELNLWSNLNERGQYRALLQQQGSVRNLEIQLQTKSGEDKTVLLSTEVRTLEGQDCVIVVLRDITDRKAVEIALQRYERIVSATTDAISLVDRQYRYQMVNYTYLEWNHKSYTEIVGHSISDQIGQEVFETVVQPRLDRCFAGETIQCHEWFEFPALGRQFLSVTYSPYLEVDQTISGVVVSGRNITPLKRAEIALQESETRFQEIAQTINQVFYVISVTTGQYLYISPAYEKMWGYSCESLYQNPKSWLERIHTEDLDSVLQALNQSFSGNQGRIEYRIFSPNGGVRWIEAESLTVHDEDGNPLRVVGLADDVTERKRLEQSLQAQAEKERLLTSITQKIRQSLDLDQILATTVVEVQQTLQADRILIFQLHQDGSGQVIQEAVSPEYPIIKQMHWLDECFPDECYEYYRQGNVRIVPDVATDEWTSCLAEFMQEAGVKSKVVAPIVQVGEAASTKVWGLLVVHACSYYRQWQEAETDFLQRICNQLAIAIGQANLYQQLQTELAERRQAEAALQEREAMLRAIGDNLPKGFIYQRVYEPGKGFYYSYVSAGIERLLGIKPEALLENPKVIRTVGFDEDLALADQLVQESLKNLSPIEIQMRNRTAQGKIQWSSIRSTPRRLDNGRIVWDGVEVDITELKRIEAALRTSEEQFRRAFDDAPIGISLVSTTGQFVKVNSRYCDLLGYTEAELLSLTFQEITHPADLETDLAGFQQMIAGETRSFQLEKRYITKQGTVLPVLMNAALIRDQNEQPLYSVGQVQDIRDRLKVERMKDEFISIISHELRTPLTSIRGALGILGSGVFDDRPAKAQHMLQIAINNSDRLVRLVNDILSLERLESGKVQLVRENCQATNLMQQAVDSVQAIADQSAVTLSVTPLTATLWAAPDAIVQTLTNLLSNAIKFSAPGDTVWLKAEECGDAIPAPCIRFSITDQGRGIPEDKLETIFEQFQQVDVSDSRNKGGTGLGLTICKNIVQQHGGRIWAESILGQGSTFYVALPLTGKDESN